MRAIIRCSRKHSWLLPAHAAARPTLSDEQVRKFVRTVVVKVIIAPGHIAIGVSKAATRAWRLEVADNRCYEPEDDLIELSIQACLQRRGRAIRLVVSREAHGAVHSQHECELVHALAQAHQWLEQLLSGEVSSLRMMLAHWTKASVMSASRYARHFSPLIW